MLMDHFRFPNYVGASTDIEYRVAHHNHTMAIPFDHVRYVLCPEQDMFALERRLIEFYDPPFNFKDSEMAHRRRGKQREQWGRLADYLEKLKMEKWQNRVNGVLGNNSSK